MTDLHGGPRFFGLERKYMSTAQILDLLEEILAAGSRAILKAMPRGPLDKFDLAVFERAVSTGDAVRLLLSNDHWETASAAVRQLFELCVHMEHIETYPNRAAAVARFSEYGDLQQLLGAQRELQHSHYKGQSASIQDATTIEMALAHPHKSQFLRTSKDGKRTHWAQSWCDKNLKELCVVSERKLRMMNYEILYSAWSEQVHGTPGSLYERIRFHLSPQPLDYYQALETDRVNGIGTMAVTMLLELWERLPGSPPGYEAERHLWATRLTDIGTLHAIDLGSLAQRHT
ncbi:DUF5677 domain-containing protein [Arthrobacter glacialis]|uniref:DUF5677 domain-containing protein n=1 Tax=Arthrobacter glacialis TaxID=1664 RepID=UPI000CD3EB23|nr:DUF5677 domain-containing protein [Arthrobacter glacialis]POH60156.1 hypothetical protein CVS28_04215 [Arthrobacter glacialis]